MNARFCLFLLLSCAPGTSDDGEQAGAAPGGTDSTPAEAGSGDDARAGPASERSLLDAAREVVGALAERDFAALADRVDPEQGVLLAPYSYVEPGAHVRLSADDLRAVARGDVAERRWGSYDGTGDPIELPFREYIDRFVCDRPYLERGEVAVDERQGSGNSLDNATEVWPDARIVEYHVPGADPRFGGMDWRSLRLVFEEVAGQWRLVGVVHDEWTI